MSFIQTILLLASIVTFGNSANAAGSPPRLWEVTGKNEQGVTGKFYILPVTHNGLAAEHDDYFYKTIVPIAMQADVFLSEKSLMFAHEAPSCPTPLADSRKNRKILAQARAAVEKATYDFAGPAPEPDGISEQDRLEIREAMHVMARMEAERLSEYGLLLQMKTYLVSTQFNYPERMPKLDADYMSRPEISHYLFFVREKAGRANASIDEKYDLFEMYCNMGERRAKYLQQQLAWWAPSNLIAPSKTEIARFSAGFVDSMKSGRASALFSTLPTLTTEYDQQVVCERNDKWIKRMRSSLGTDVRFYALGLMHVVQPASNNHFCDGLLVRLRKEGFAVRLVR